MAAHAVAVFARERVTVAIVVGYGPGPLVTPTAEQFRARLLDAGVELREMLRVEGGRYWSYLCTDPGCCAADGVVFDVSASRIAAQLTVAGNVTLPDRAALAATIAPLHGQVRALMREATRRAQDRAASPAQPPTPRSAGVPRLPGAGQRGALPRQVVIDGLRAVSEAIGIYRSGGLITDDDVIAWLGVTLTDLRVRDDAWARMDPEHTAAHRALWADVVRRVEPGYVPAPACLLAFAAWQAGDGALANVAIDRALQADSGYSMALLLLDAVSGGLPPSAATLPMTPQEVAASYAAAERRTKRNARRRGRKPPTQPPSG
jgi:hypothetical protein